MIEAGRELDAMVAEQIMQLKLVGEKDYDICYEIKRCGQNWYPSVPHYSTQISAAWEVVEKLLDWEFKLFGGERHADGWYAMFIGNYGNWHSDINSVTPAHAICLAALAAVEAK